MRRLLRLNAMLIEAGVAVVDVVGGLAAEVLRRLSHVGEGVEPKPKAEGRQGVEPKPKAEGRQGVQPKPKAEGRQGVEPKPKAEGRQGVQPKPGVVGDRD